MTTINPPQSNNRRNQALSRLSLAERFQFDLVYGVLLFFIIGFGLLMVYSATFDLGIQRINSDSLYFFKRQFGAAILGFFAIVIMLQFDYVILTKLSVPMLGFTVLLLLTVLIAGATINGATRWLTAGGSYQPSELAKLALTVYIAHWVATKGDRIRDITYGLIPFSIIVAVVCGLVVIQPAVSSTILIGSIAVTIFFIGGADWKQFVILGCFAAILIPLMILVNEHARIRVSTFRTAFSDPTTAVYQVQQGLIALGLGGSFGVGIGQGAQKFTHLPFAHTDGIFAIIGEELGFAGTFGVIVLFALLVWRGVVIANNARTKFGMYLALGVTCWFAYQALIHMAVITTVIPVTGMTLPFISYGGSAMFINMIAAGMVLSISRDGLGNRPVRKRSQVTVNSEASSRPSTSRPRRTQVAGRAPARRRNRRAESSNFEEGLDERLDNNFEEETELASESSHLRRRNRRGNLPRARSRR
ncbi:MAG: FtsW/RodA/SpoVE family cell cycle protein [Anaerolineae bacterium]